MNNYFILLKNSFNNFIGAIVGKRKIKSIATVIALVVLMFAGFYALMFLQAFGMFAAGLYKLGFFNGFMIAFVLLIMYEAIRVTGANKINDAELLLSMPIKKQTIALAKITIKYFTDLLFAFMAFSPYLIFYLVYAGFSFSILGLGILTILLLPLMAVGFNYILEFIVANVFNKSKYGSLFKTILTFVIFIGGLALMMFAMPNYGSVNAADLDAFLYGFPPVSWFVKMTLDFDILTFLFVLSITVLPFLIGIWCFVKMFGKTFIKYQNTSTEISEVKHVSVLNSLTLKELKRYFLTPIYLINTILGPLFVLAATVFILVVGVGGINDFVGFPLPNELIFAVLTLMFMFFISTSAISASTISLEGKNLWILKSIPVKEKDVFISKMFPNFIVVVPFVVLSGILISIRLLFTLPQTLLFVGITTVFSLIIVVSGLMFNLVFPKFNWNEEVQVVKQGLSILIVLFMGFALIALPIGLFYLFDTLSITIIAVITLLIFTAILAVFWILLFTKGKQLFNKL